MAEELVSIWSKRGEILAREPRIKPLEKSECDSEQLSILKSLGSAGSMNAFRTLVRHPKLVQRFLPFLQYILQESSLTTRDTELLILRTAWDCRAEYEWSHHSVSGKQAGLSDEEILRVSKGPTANGWTRHDKALLEAADELHSDSCASDSVWRVLSEKYSEQQLVDIVFTVGMYTLASMSLKSFGVELDRGLKGFPE